MKQDSGTAPTLFDMTGQVALITGSSRGIGRATAEAMAAQGARVVISSRKADACDAVTAMLNDRHGAGTAVAIPANISDKTQLQALVSRTEDALGPVTALVCNAASNPYYGPMDGITDEQFRKILDNNILSNHWLIAMVAPGMCLRGCGSITIISSIGGLRGSTVIGAYCISKAADMQLARNLADEFGPRGVRVNCIAPGLIRTDFAKALTDNPEMVKHATRGSSLQRVGEPLEIAGAAVFLASPAGSYVTGQTLVVDGGATSSGLS